MLAVPDAEGLVRAFSTIWTLVKTNANSDKEQRLAKLAQRYVGDWLAGCLVDGWLLGWVVGCLVGWLVGGLV